MIPKVIIKKPPHVSIWLEEGNDHILKQFHCIHCGRIVFEYYNPVRIVIVGEHIEKSPKVVQCQGNILVDLDTGHVMPPGFQKQEGDIARYKYVRCKAKYWIS